MKGAPSELNLPDPADWVRYLENEIGRREKRQFFLWTVVVSILGVGVYSGSQLFWNGTADMLEAYIYGSALGAIVFLLILGPIAARMLHLANSRQSFTALNLKQVLVLVRLVNVVGIPWSNKSGALPEILAAVLVLAGSWLAAGSLDVPLARAVLLFGVALLAFQMISVLLPRKMAASLVCFSVLSIARARGLVDPQWNGKVAGELRSNIRSKALRKALESPSNPVRPGLDFLIKVVWLVILGLFASLFALRLAEVSQLDKTVLADSLAATFVTLSGLAFLRLLLVLYFDDTRILLEQLRLALFLNGFSKQLALMSFILIEGLQQMRMHTNDALADLVAVLRLEEVFWMDVPQQVLKDPQNQGDASAGSQ